jgi:hypothetical protein
MPLSSRCRSDTATARSGLGRGAPRGDGAYLLRAFASPRSESSPPRARFIVEVLGLDYFAAVLVLRSPPAWRSTPPPLRWIRVLSVPGGVGFAAATATALAT